MHEGDETGWYLFGILPADSDIGVDECPPFDERCPVRLVRAANLFALAAQVPVADLPGPVSPDPERLTALVGDHDRILREAASTGRGLVPMPFGTVTRDLDALRRTVEDHCVTLYDAIARLEGCDEWGVHVSVPREAPQRAVRALTRQVHDGLAACSEDAVIEPIESGATEERPSALSAAFLVNRDRAKHFHHTVEDLRRYWESAGGAITVSGPWPAYHFARVDLGSVGSEQALLLLGPLSTPERAWSTT